MSDTGAKGRSTTDEDEFSETSLPSAAARDAAAVALRGSERGMAKMGRSGN